MKTEKRIFGDFGESVASKFLMKHGFTIVERNYLRRWGEIDLIAKRGEMYHFVEVKTVKGGVSTAAPSNDEWRAEENIHPSKLQRLSRTIQTYLLEKNIEGEWQFDAIVVELSLDQKKAKVRYIPNIVI